MGTGNVLYLVEADNALMAFGDQVTLIIEHTWRAPGTKYVGSGKKRGRGPRILEVPEMS